MSVCSDTYISREWFCTHTGACIGGVCYALKDENLYHATALPVSTVILLADAEKYHLNHRHWGDGDGLDDHIRNDGDGYGDGKDGNAYDYHADGRDGYGYGGVYGGGSVYGDGSVYGGGGYGSVYGDEGDEGNGSGCGHHDPDLA